MLGSPRAPETLFEEMKRYVRFGDADAALLLELLAHARPGLPAISTAFYERIREHEGAHAVFTGEEQVARLKHSLVRWMERVCTGPHDEAYFEQTANIGRMHVRVGLPQRYMFTAMALIRVALVRIADAKMGEKAAATREAITRALDLELAIMLETYRDDFVNRIQERDRLERDRIGKGLAQVERRSQHAVELARVLIVGLDCDARVRLMNPEAERVTGMGREEVIGRTFAEALLPEGLVEEHGATFGKVARGELAAPDLLESAVRTRAGKVRHVAWRLAYAQEAGDDVVLFAVGRDTTDDDTLATRLRQSEKLAAIGTLAAGLAHEIRNPLHGAQLHVTFLERGLKRAGFADPEALEAVQVVGAEIKRLGLLVDEFLDFARPKPLDRSRASIKGLCERVRRLVTAPAASPDLVVVLDLPTTDVEIVADPPKIEQVLLNLLRNAIEAATPANGGRVVLRARREPRVVVVEVEDDGPGLSDSAAPIFDAFFSTKAQGTGLGLAIAHRIVTDHGGSIGVESRPGRTVFRVTLPLELG